MEALRAEQVLMQCLVAVASNPKIIMLVRCSTNYYYIPTLPGLLSTVHYL